MRHGRERVVDSASASSVYCPRKPRESPLYKLIERYLPQFEHLYPERFEKRYGPWRPIIGEVARKFLRCSDLHFGFARVRCCGGDCGHEMFVPFSCRQRCLCPSCHQKRWWFDLLSARKPRESINIGKSNHRSINTVNRSIAGRA